MGRIYAIKAVAPKGQSYIGKSSCDCPITVQEHGVMGNLVMRHGVESVEPGCHRNQAYCSPQPQVPTAK